VLYADVPLGEGFSNAYNVSALDSNQTQVADDVLYLLQQFLIQHPEYNGRDLYITGDGYNAAPLALLTNKILENQHNLNLKLKGWYVAGPLIFLCNTNEQLACIRL